jgi:preprotein translocase subunit YajC
LSLTQILLAQTTQPATTPAGAPPPDWLQFVGSMPFMLLMLLVVFFIFTMGGKRKEEKQRQNMLSRLKKGDRVQTIGGILGTVVEARDNEVLVKVDESTNTKMKFTRSAIHRVVEEEKTETK